MARSEARLSVSIWTDPDFLALTPTAQRMFMFLLSQPDLAHDGVIALRERRWSKSAAGMTVAQVSHDLDELSAARFVVIDEDAEEMLIRSFIRRDKVYRQPNVLRAACDHLAVVSSPVILAAIAAELHRVMATEDIAEPSRRIVAEMLEAIEKAFPKGTGNPSGNPSDRSAPSAEQTDTERERDDVSAGDRGSGNPSANPSGNPSAGTPGERGVVTAVSRDSPFPVPRSPSLNTSPTPQRVGAADAAFDEFWSTYPRREAKGAARKAWDKAIKRADPAVILAGAGRYRDQPGRDPRYTAHPATWLNADRWSDEAAPARTNGRTYESFRNPEDVEAAYGGTL